MTVGHRPPAVTSMGSSSETELHRECRKRAQVGQVERSVGPLRRRQGDQPCEEVGGLACLSVGEIRRDFCRHDSNLGEWLVSAYF